MSRFTQWLSGNWISKAFFTGCCLPKVVTETPELPRTRRSLPRSLGCSPAAFPSWGGTKLFLQELTTGRQHKNQPLDASHCSVLPVGPGRATTEGAPAALGDFYSHYWFGAALVRDLLLMAKPLRSQTLQHFFGQAPTKSICVYTGEEQSHCRALSSRRERLQEAELSEAKATAGFLHFLGNSSYALEVLSLLTASSLQPASC